MINFLKKNFFIVTIIALALIVRVVAATPGYPPVHPDEGASYLNAIDMMLHNLEPNRFDYPALMPLLNMFVFIDILSYVVLPQLFIFHPKLLLAAIGLGNQFLAQWQELIFGPGRIDALYWSRYISVSVGTGAIFMTYLIGSRLFNKKVGLIAAFFAAFNYRHVLGSTFGLPDVYNSFFSLLALYTSCLLLEKNTKKNYLLAGFTVGLAIATKYQIFSIFPFLFVHLTWVIQQRKIKYLFNKYFLLSLIIIPVVFLMTNPYLLPNFKEFSRMSNIIYLRYQMGIFKLRLAHYFYLYHWGIGKLPFIAIFIGMITMLLSKPKKFMLIFAFVFPFFFSMTYYSGGGGFPRNFATVIPMLMIFAGYFVHLIDLLLKKISFIRGSGVIIVALLLFINFYPIKDSLVLAYSYSRSWTSTIFNPWIENNLPSNSKLRTYPSFMTSNTSLALQARNIQMLTWSYSSGPHSVAEFQDDGTDFAVMNASFFNYGTYWWKEGPNYTFLKYKSVPFEYIQSSFLGLSLKEFMEYTVKEIYKPWQALDESTYLIFKTPPKPKDLGKQIAYFGFNSSDNMWKIRNIYWSGNPKVSWAGSEGRASLGSLLFDYGIGEETARISSKPIKISPGKLYTAKGWMKNSSKTEKKDGESFLRMDFYKDNKEATLEMLGEKVALSSRGKVMNNWEEVSATSIAPFDAQYMTISFQRYELHNDISSYLDDVSVYESNKPLEEKFKILPYIKSTIPLESVYPNSFL